MSRPPADLVREIFSSAAALAGTERERVLGERCGTDDALRREIESLLEHDARAPETFFADVAFSPLDGRGAATSVLGPYVLLRELGRGGQGVVHLGRDTRLPRLAALKVLWPDVGAADEIALRFRREAEVVSRIDHPGICSVYDTGIDDGLRWIAFRYVPGTTLAARLQEARMRPAPVGGSPPPPAAGSRERRPPPSRPGTRVEIVETCRLIEKAARALHAAHESGVIHRDIKPGNLMVTPAGDPVILDFGLARDDTAETLRLTRSGEIFGTPAYMSPEQLRGPAHPLDRRTDVYSLGVTLYECLTLRLPHDRPTRDGMCHAILNDEPTSARRLNPRIPADLETVVATAMARNPGHRYQTAEDFAADLDRVCRLEPIRARSPGTLVRLLRWAQRKPGIAASLSGLILSLVVGLAVSLVAWRSARSAAEVAEREREASRFQAYRSQIAGAAASLAAHDIAAARKALADAPPDLRGFEWSWLHRLAWRHIAELTFAEPVSMLVPGPDAGDALAVSSSGVCFPVRGGEGAATPAPRLDPLPGRLAGATTATGLLLSLDPCALHDLRTGRSRWSRPDLAAENGAIDAEGTLIAILIRDGKRLALLDPESGAERRSFPAPLEDIREISVGSGAGIVLGGAFGTLAVDPESGTIRWRSTSVFGRSTADGRFVIALGTGREGAVVLAAADGEVLARVPGARGEPITAFADDPAGGRAALADSLGRLAMTEVPSGRLLGTIPAPEGSVRQLLFADRGQILLARTDSAVAAFDSWALSDRLVVEPTSDANFGAALSPDGSMLATVGWGAAQLWGTRTGAQLRTVLIGRRYLHAAAWSQDGQVLACGGVGGELHLVDPGSGRFHSLPGTPGGTVIGLAWLSEGRIAAAIDDGRCALIDPDTGTVAHAPESPAGRAWAIAGDPRGERFAIASGGGGTDPGQGNLPASVANDFRVVVRDASSGRPLRTFGPLPSAVCGLAFSACGSLLAAAGHDGTARVWRIADGTPVIAVVLTSGPLLSAAFDPPATHAAFGSEDGAVHVVDLRRGEPVARLDTRKVAPHTLRWEADRIVLSGGGCALMALEIGPHRPFPARALVQRARAFAEALAADRFCDEVVAHLRQRDDLSPELREAAIAAALARGDQPNFLNSQAWGVVISPGLPAERYETAYRQAKVACRLFPEDYALLNTLGIAAIRSGRAEEAIQVLEHCLELPKGAGRPPHPLDLAGLSLACHRAGRREDAARWLERAREALGDQRMAGDRESVNLVEEARRALEAP